MSDFIPGDPSKQNDSPLNRYNFDSRLIRPTTRGVAAELRITLKLFLDPQNPPAGDPEFVAKDGNNISFPVARWDTPPMAPTLRTGYFEGNWNSFTKLVVEDANKFWNDRMWLKTPALYQGLDVPLPSGRRWRPNVRCTFECKLVEKGDAHLRILCWRLLLVKGKFPSVMLQSTLVDGKAFTSEARLYDSLDLVSTRYDMLTQVGNILAGTSFDQVPVCHEIGHALGLEHSAANVPNCANPYGACTAAEEWMPRNIMGRGSDIHPPFNARPWIHRIEQHTGYKPGSLVIPSFGPGEQPGGTLQIQFDGWQAFDRASFQPGVEIP